MDRRDSHLHVLGDTIFAALSTAILMEEPEIVHRILGHVQNVDFLDPKGDHIDIGVATARFLGSMLSAYDLLKGPYSHILGQVRRTSSL
jgi:mannosyl-oligosaccharide alpha-1,2-mannosidase